MRLLNIFLEEIGSKYVPGEVIKINNKRFTLFPELPFIIPEQTYAGFYLGQNKKRFEPSSLLLQKLSKEDETHKVFVDRSTAWLFVVGKDVFDENIINKTRGVTLGGYCLVIFKDYCLGYGRYETSHNKKVVKNIFDIGDFLRREE